VLACWSTFLADFIDITLTFILLVSLGIDDEDENSINKIDRNINRTPDDTSSKRKSQGWGLFMTFRNLARVEAHAIRHIYGEYGADETDQESDVDEDTKKRMNDATPTTRRRMLSEMDTEHTGKIGPVKTFFTLLKGFVAAGVLFLPKGWVNGGWLFSTLCLLASWVLTTVTSLKLVEIRKKYKLSFSEIGMKAYGLPGKVAVDFFLWFTQTIFVWAYVTFIVDSVNNILDAHAHGTHINKWILGAICFVIYVPLWLIRKIEKFAFFHIFADIGIIIGVITITIYAIVHVSDEGFSEHTEMINNKLFLSFVGLAAYTFEGIGIIIPVMETTSRPDLYPMIVASVIFSITVVYIIFGNFNYFAYGYKKLHEHPLITSILPRKDIPVAIVEIIWIINLIFTYPLVIHPANMVIESYVFRSWAQSKSRTWLKNFSRAIMVGFTVVLSVALMETLDKLESINGAFACIPLAFLLPCLFHYKLVATTRKTKIIDLTITGISLVLMITCTVVTFKFWSD
jgi:solute carrier family 36 (proton-coupled amino acid transporter)